MEAVARCKDVGVRVTGMRGMGLGVSFDVNVHGGLERPSRRLLHPPMSREQPAGCVKLYTGTYVRK